MKLLYANDQPGKHAPSWYEATCPTTKRPVLERAINADVCVIGAGFTGLAAALELSRCGISTVVLDAHRIGWGASGRNGGQLGTGFNQHQDELAKWVGSASARAMWTLAEESKSHIHNLCKQHDIHIDYIPGIVYAEHRKRGVKPAHDYCNTLRRDYGYRSLEPLTRAGIRSRVDSDDYHGGVIDHGAGHIHPLKLATGLAHAAEAAGARVHELSEVVRIDPIKRSRGQRVVTAQGSVTCHHVVLGVNGYLDNLVPTLNKHVMPINNFIAVTAPLGDRSAALLPYNDAVADSRFVVNYFRRVGADRLLFGGGENYSYRFPSTIERTVRKAMLGVFPQLGDVPIDYTWGGTLAVTRHRLPYVAQLNRQLYTAGGYSGHGVALAPMVGTAIAEHIDGRTDRFELLSRIPGTCFPGGTLSRSALLALAMSGYAFLDRL